MALPPGYHRDPLAAHAVGDRTRRSQPVRSCALQTSDRPATHRAVPTWRHGAALSNYLIERTKLTEALDRYQRGANGDQNPLPPVQAVGRQRAMGKHWRQGLDVMRSLVILNPNPQVVFTGLPWVFAIAVTPTRRDLLLRLLRLIPTDRTLYKFAACSIPDKFSAKFPSDRHAGRG